MKRTKIRAALKDAALCLRQAGLDYPLEEAEIILAHLMNTDRLRLFLRRAETLPPGIVSSYRQAVNRRAAGEPLAYILGEKYFYSYRFIVNNSVLIPRPETELIVERALDWVERRGRVNCDPIRVVDLGTGSGVLAISLALLLKPCTVWAIDSSEDALEIAQKNAELHSVEGQILFAPGNYFDALQAIDPVPLFNLVVANPPYVQADQLSVLPESVKNYEPMAALNGGKDGLAGFRAILAKLHLHVSPPALILFETGASQNEAVEALCRHSGLSGSISWHCDLAGKPRVLEVELS